MNFFKKLFGGDSSANDNSGSKADEQFLQSPEVKQILEKYKRKTTLLGPLKASAPLGLLDSKFGGTPNAIGFDTYPHCPVCGTPMNFTLQLYRSHFPEMYFPGTTDLFQLFRCPNFDCTGGDEKYDQVTQHYYVHAKGLTKELANPGHNLESSEDPAIECELRPVTAPDYPNYDDFEDGETDALQEKYGEDMLELFTDTYTAAPNTKCGGYPSFTQYPHYPFCTCGKMKEFFFQLASDDAVHKPHNADGKFEWAPHGIMMGDVGNIYFYVCRSCGPETIETYWDCS